MSAIAAIGRFVLCALIRFYQWVLSPFFAGSCRYVPSCSHYALEAVERHGAMRGAWLALCRLSRCHPWGRSGLDPVPDLPARSGAKRYRSI